MLCLRKQLEVNYRVSIQTCEHMELNSHSTNTIVLFNIFSVFHSFLISKQLIPRKLMFTHNQ